MIANNVRVSYTCTNCKIPYVVNYYPIQEIVDVVKNMDRIKHCAVCGQSMNIVKAVFKTVKNTYEDATGYWRCPTHIGFTYYPSLLKKIVSGKLSIVTVGQAVYDRYIKIASTGQPWKCPMCGTVMRYIDE